MREALTGRAPIDRETVPAGMVTFLGEAGLALPVWLAALSDCSNEDIAALYAALRVAALFSWAAGAVAAAVTPRLALAIARRRGVARLLVRSTAAATLTTLPLVAVGLLAPDAILRLLAGRGADGGLLVILVLGRAIDACTGPVSEALIVGRRARLELVNMLVFFVVVVVAGLLLVGDHGVSGLAVAVAIGTAACNIPRLIEVVVLLRGPWADGDGTPRRATATGRRARVRRRSSSSRARRSTSPPRSARSTASPASAGCCSSWGRSRRPSRSRRARRAAGRTARGASS